MLYFYTATWHSLYHAYHAYNTWNAVGYILKLAILYTSVHPLALFLELLPVEFTESEYWWIYNTNPLIKQAFLALLQNMRYHRSNYIKKRPCMCND